jgi:hypothetical protein
MADGSFSQYSVNYHRLMLDTYSLVEHWRRGLELPAFSPRLYDRLAAATRWLQALTQPETGDAPVLGANDGARLLPLGDSDYRDYRPAVQLAMALFLDRRAYGGEARRLVQAGHEVTLVCGSYAGAQTGLTGPFRDGRRAGRVDGIQVIELELPYANRDGFLKRALTFVRFAWRSTWIVLRRDYDVVFATTTPLTAGIPGICARWLRGKPFVFEVRDLWPELPKAMGVITNPLVLWALGVLEWLSYRSAQRLVGLSPGIVDGIARRGVARERITLIPMSACRSWPMCPR